MYYTVYESHAKFLELIANSLSPRDVETAADRRAEGVTRALRVIAENVATLDAARRPEADEARCRNMADALEEIANYLRR